MSAFSRADLFVSGGKVVMLQLSTASTLNAFSCFFAWLARQIVNAFPVKGKFAGYESYSLFGTIAVFA